jgi:transcriptional regulator with XRE-family HTH domain
METETPSASEVIGERIRNLRIGKGLSQQEVAGRLGLQPAALCHFETGLRIPSFENLRKLADFYAVSVDYLLGRVEEPKASGPEAEALFRSIDGIDPDDLKALVAMAQSLAARNRRHHKAAEHGE